MNKLVEELIQKGVLHSQNIIAAFLEVDRRDFLPAGMKELAYIDEALPLTEDQTASQPSVVAFMLELLEAKNGDMIMEIGYGSGWVTALLAELVGEMGRVYAIEVRESLCQFGLANVKNNYPDLLTRIQFYCLDGTDGLAGDARMVRGFDAVIAAAAVEKVPEAWRAQLKTGGKLIYPQNFSILREKKQLDGTFAGVEYPGYVFVPFWHKEENEELF